MTTESGWVGDNCLAYARLIKWIHYPLSLLPVTDEEKYIELIIPVKHRNKKLCRDLLIAYGIKCDGIISEWRLQIESLKQNDKSPLIL